MKKESTICDRAACASGSERCECQKVSVQRLSSRPTTSPNFGSPEAALSKMMRGNSKDSFGPSFGCVTVIGTMVGDTMVGDGVTLARIAATWSSCVGLFCVGTIAPLRFLRGIGSSKDAISFVDRSLFVFLCGVPTCSGRGRPRFFPTCFEGPPGVAGSIPSSEGPPVRPVGALFASFAHANGRTLLEGTVDIASLFAFRSCAS